MSKYIYSLALKRTPDAEEDTEGYVEVAFANNFQSDMLDDDIYEILEGIGLENDDETNFNIPRGQWDIIRSKLEALTIIKYSPSFQRYIMNECSEEIYGFLHFSP